MTLPPTKNVKITNQKCQLYRLSRSPTPCRYATSPFQGECRFRLPPPSGGSAASISSEISLTLHRAPDGASLRSYSIPGSASNPRVPCVAPLRKGWLVGPFACSRGQNRASTPLAFAILACQGRKHTILPLSCIEGCLKGYIKRAALGDENGSSRIP